MNAMAKLCILSIFLMSSACKTSSNLSAMKADEGLVFAVEKNTKLFDELTESIYSALLNDADPIERARFIEKYEETGVLKIGNNQENIYCTDDKCAIKLKSNPFESGRYGVAGIVHRGMQIAYFPPTAYVGGAAPAQRPHIIGSASGNHIACANSTSGSIVSGSKCKLQVTSTTAEAPANALKIDNTMYASFSIGIQNVLYQASREYREVIVKTQNGDGFTYTGSEYVFQCTSLECNVSSGSITGKLATALKFGMNKMGLNVVGNPNSGPSMACVPHENQFICEVKMETGNPLMTLRDALAQSSSAPLLNIIGNQNFNRSLVINRLKNDFKTAFSGTDCKNSTSSDKTKVTRALNDRVQSDDVRAALQALAPVLSGMAMSVGTNGSTEACTGYAVFEIYERNGNLLRAEFSI